MLPRTTAFPSRRLASWLFGLTLTLLVAACARNQESNAAADMAASAPESATVAMEEASGADTAEASDSAAAMVTRGVDGAQLVSQTGMASDPKRQFRVTASAQFQVKNVYETANRIEDMAIAAGGFVAGNSISTDVEGGQSRRLGDGSVLRLTEVVTRGELTVRVPADRTNAFLRDLAKHMDFLDERAFAAEDMQFELLRRQLAYARNQQLQTEAARAGDQPSRVGEKLDAAGMRAYALEQRDAAVVSQRELEDAIAFSTIRLNLYQDAQVRQQIEPDTEALMATAGPGFFQRIGIALQAGWRGLLQAIVIATYLWPLWLVLSVIASALWQWRRAVRRRRAARSTVVVPDLPRQSAPGNGEATP